MQTADTFENEYTKLNPAQKEAVDAIDGPVMVVAGPGTGKTQILALRIGNILKKTDIKAESILCLTFTNSSVKAMKERLSKYIGSEYSKVKVVTFHGFGMDIISKYYNVLGLDEEPKIMDEKDSIMLYDEILNNNDWLYLKPRSDTAKYFKDIKSLISILKKENINREDFEIEIQKEIERLQNDPASISSRGESKGELKKDILKKIEGLYRTLEVGRFYALYEQNKKVKNLFDYDDILENLNQIVEESDEVRNYIKENFLYVLVDEHQDSNGVQNKFLEKVWKGEDRPDIFVVGDDRQLIYGFSGASLEYFENFKNTFGKAELIYLVENYRSTENILNTAHTLLNSSITQEKLKSNTLENNPLSLVEAYYPRDEILFIGLDIKDKIEKGIDPNQIAILVPKNRYVYSTISILKDMGINVAGMDKVNLFDTENALSFARVLKILAKPDDNASFAESFFDKNSNIPPLKAHKFIKNSNIKNFSLLELQEEKNTLFDNTNEINVWINKLKLWLSSDMPIYNLVQKVGTEFLIESSADHKELILNIEIVRTFLHLILFQIEKNPKLKLTEFLEFLDRLEEYGENIPLAIFEPNHGVKVLTLHGSKGLEFDSVYIAHMDEGSFTGNKVIGFTLPEIIKEKIENKDLDVLKRQLYVAITRAKRFCTISYSLNSYTGGTQEKAQILDLIDEFLVKQSREETEKIILKNNPKVYIESNIKETNTTLPDLLELVAKNYEDTKISVSLLNNFFECPWKWYFRNLLKLPEGKTKSLDFGNIVHYSLEQILKSEYVISIKDVESIVLNEVNKIYQIENKEHQDTYKSALSVVLKWFKNRFDTINKSRKSEQNISINDKDFPNLNISGKIDLIEILDDANMRVTDFKTGTPRKKSEIEKLDEEGRMSTYMRQLAMYSYLIDRSPKWQMSVSQSVLEFIEAKSDNESFYKTFITDEQIKLLVKDISDYNHLLKSGEWVRRPCNYNGYGKNTECEYCKLAEIYK